MWRVSIFDRYLIQSFLGPLFFSLAGFIIVGLVDITFTLVDLFVNSGVAFAVVLRLLLYKIPAIIVMFLPMSTVFSGMLLFIQMAKDNEITVIRTSGISVFRMITPVLLMAVLVSTFSLAINEWVAPWANHVSDNLVRHAVRKSPPPKIANNVVFKEAGNRFFYVQSIDRESGLMENLLIFERIKGSFPRIITAQSAKWDTDRWYLSQGYQHEMHPSGDLKHMVQYEQMEIFINRDLNSFYSSHLTPRQMNSKTLKEKIDRLDSSGMNTSNLKMAYHIKKSLPAACFVFCLMGVTFCVMFVKTGRDWWGVIWAIVAVVMLVGFYFFLVAMFRAIGRQGEWSPLLCAWIPNMVYFFPCTGLIIHDGLTR